MAATYTRYRNVVIRDYLGKPDADEIKDLESAIEVALPNSFRTFLDVANGGNLEGYYLTVDHPEMKVTRSFDTFYGTRRRLESSDYGLFGHELKLSREAAKLPPQVLPIARDNTGCELYLDLTDEGEERVVAFIHGMPDLDQQPKDNAWVTLALSFDDYIDQLRVDEEQSLEALREARQQNSEERIVQLVDFLDQAVPEWRSNPSFEEYKDLPGTPRH